MISKMSVVYMGCSLEDDLEMKEGVAIQLKQDTRESSSISMIENVEVNAFDLEPEFDFWPIQHPSEPSHEDRPVQCPMPHSSHLIKDERMQDDRVSCQTKSEEKAILNKDDNALESRKPAMRMVRKRHHDHTNTIIPSLPMSPLCPYSHQKAVFNKIKQVPKFES